MSDTSSATYRTRHQNPTQAEAEEEAKAKYSELDRGTRSLNLTVMGNPALGAEMTIKIAGVRERVDDTWRVKTATHTINGDGYRTTLDCEKPGQGGAAGSSGS